MKKEYIILVIVALMISGCTYSTKFSGISPIYPKHRSKIDQGANNTIVFEWERMQGNPIYDFSLWEAIWLETQKRYVTGKQILVKERISGTKLEIDNSLSPGKSYLWSIKLHYKESWSKTYSKSLEFDLFTTGHKNTSSYFLFSIK